MLGRIFYSKGGEVLSQIGQRRCRSLEVFRAKLFRAWSNLVWWVASLSMAERLERDDLKRFFQPKPFHHSCEVRHVGTRHCFSGDEDKDPLGSHSSPAYHSSSAGSHPHHRKVPSPDQSIYSQDFPAPGLLIHLLQTEWSLSQEQMQSRQSSP